MKNLLPVVAYVLVLIIVVMLPASQGYDELIWKLLIGQVYAIPVFLITLIISRSLSKKKANSY